MVPDQPHSENPFVECSDHFTPLLPSSSPIPLSTELALEISRFSLDGYAQHHFAKHKTGLFIKKKVPIETLVRWSKTSISRPLTVINKNLNKEAVRCFRFIQHIMDHHLSLKKRSKRIQHIVNKCINHGELRDEIYAQLVKQLTNNPSRDSLAQGWTLMGCICSVFPPSKNLELYLHEFLENHLNSPDPEIASLAKFSLKRLARTCSTNFYSRTQSILEIERLWELPFSNLLFDESLDNIMALELQISPSSKVPRILLFLIDAIRFLGGISTEGIFRVSGESDQVVQLKIGLERGNYRLDPGSSPHVPASLLKLWLRELSDPLIPQPQYDEFIDCTSPKEAVKLVETLPDNNRNVIAELLPLFKVNHHHFYM